jgi:hypothetical protein
MGALVTWGRGDLDGVDTHPGIHNRDPWIRSCFSVRNTLPPKIAF